MMQGVSETTFAKAMNKVLRAGDFGRAKKLLAAVDAPIGVATHAALVTVIDGAVLRRDDAEDYRTAGATLDPALVKERLTQTFVRAYDGARRAMVWRRFVGALGAVLLALVLADHIGRRLVAVPMIGSILALALLLWTARRDGVARGAAIATFALLRDVMYARAIEPVPSEVPVTVAAFTLVIEEPGAAPREFAVHEPVIRIGRGANAEVQLACEEVARMHAVIELGDGALTIIDLGASPGTLVNGASVNKHELSDGDRVTIGPCTLTVRARG